MWFLTTAVPGVAPRVLYLLGETDRQKGQVSIQGKDSEHQGVSGGRFGV